MKRVQVLLALLLVLGALVAGRANGSNSSSSSSVRLIGLEQDVLARLNVVRMQKGLHPLAASAGLTRAAAVHSQSMLADGYFEHESADGSPFDLRLRHYYPLASYDEWTVGENLLYSSRDISATAVIATWLASPPHRKNLLSPVWRDVGVGALDARAAGGVFRNGQTMVITMDFGARSSGMPVAQ